MTPTKQYKNHQHLAPVNCTNVNNHWYQPAMKKQRLDINVLKEAQAQLESLAKLELKEMLEHLDEQTEYPNTEK